MFPHRFPRPRPRNLLLSLLLLAALSATASLTPAAADHGNGNSGTIKVHDGTDTQPPTRNEPHVTGDAYVEGFNMAAHEGTLNLYSWPPTGDRTLVLATTWQDDGGDPEAHFLAGPFDLPCGHYRVEAQNGMDADDFPGGVKSKMFWVECPPTPEPEPTPSPSPSPSPGPGPEPGPEPGLACPTGLSASPNDDGSITLTWTAAPGSDGTNIYRALGDEDFEYLTTVGPAVGTYTDTTSVAGNAYAYTVTALYGDSESADCPIVEVTAIPVFPGAIGVGLAAALGLGAYVVLQRRRKA